jgi:methyltransferase, fkbM family
MISIIVPIYQVEDYIEECLLSLIEQTYENIEIICVDDCGLDNSITIVKKYMELDSRIRLINHEKNRGLGGARNTGIQAAKGEYIIFVDSDDYLDTHMVEKLYNSLVSTQSDVSVCGVMLTFPSGQHFEPHTAFHHDYLASQSTYDISQDKKILTDMWPSAWNKLFKLSIINKYHITFKERMLYEDHTFFYEYFSHCNTFSYIAEPLYFYRKERPHSITTQSTGREKEIFIILDYISQIFKTMYSDDEYQILIAKISIRLLYERCWVFNISDINYYSYLANAIKYLSKWDKAYLLNVKDDFISNDSPIFFNALELQQYQKKNLHNNTNIVRRSLHKIKNKITSKSKVLRIFNDLRWVIWDTHNRLDKFDELHWAVWDTHNQLADVDLKDISKQLNVIKNELSDLNYDIVSLSNNVESKFSSLSSLVSKINDNNLNAQISNIENTLNTSKVKIEDIWWLSWNIKDNFVNENNSSDSKFLRYYPTWLPVEYPDYFMGNTWYWSDNFKSFNNSRNGDCSKELEQLCKNLSVHDKDYIKSLWERNTRIIPYASYTDKKGYLLKKTLIFNNEELEEQNNVLHAYSNIKSEYILPNGSVYEIPVFFYEHGLKYLNQKQLDFVRNGDILDLGGFIGDSALILQKYTDNTVYSIDMNPQNISTMKYVLSTNHVENKVHPILAGVSDKDTNEFFYGDSSYSTLNHNMENIDIYKKNETIPIYTVDTLTTSLNIHPHFMKLDVEGMEYETIIGAQKTISTHRPILCISIYHTAKDFLYIKPLLESWNLGYHFHIENHNPFDPVYEKMLVCIPDII